jgi:hypothetical protein
VTAIRRLFLAALLLPWVTGAWPQTVTWEFRVQATGSNAAGYAELYSETSWQHPAALFVRLPAATPVGRFMGRTIRVSGRVQDLRFGELRRMAISVQDAAQVTILDPLPAFTPTAAYVARTVRGFTVLVHPAVMQQQPDAAQAFAELESQLDAILSSVPGQRLGALRKVRIWLEWKNREDAAAEFHPSRGWLEAHGYNPDKAGDVEICNLRNWVAWSRADQPMSLLHELAHAYHYRELGEDHPQIRAAYEHAMKSRLYESVAYIHGGRRPAYGAKSPTEYFAELSEAYFGKNDYYPFTRAEMLLHDSAGYRMVERLWSAPVPRAQPLL